MVNVVFDIFKFAERLGSLMDDFGYNTYTLAHAVSLTPGTISKYTNAKMEPKRSTIELLARHFNVNPAWLMGYDVDKWLDGQAPKAKSIPFIKVDSESSNAYMIVPIEDDVDICFLVSDNSMTNARIYEGDIAYIRKQPSVGNGEIAAITLDEVVTLKRVYIMDNIVALHSENPTIPDVVIPKKEKKRFNILGKVVYVRFEAR